MNARRITQTISLLLLNSSWGPELKWFCAPVLNCHSCALAWFACPIGVFIHYAGWRMFPFLAVGIVLLLAVLLGRLLCGWLCPFGLLQDLLHKIPSPKFGLPRWTRWIKYGVLLGLVVLTPYVLGEQTLYSFCRICPTSAIQVTIPNLVRAGFFGLETQTLIKLTILVAVVVLAIFCCRSFCRVFCPLGALLAPLNYISFWTVKTPTVECTVCGRCDALCPVEGKPSLRASKGVAPGRAAKCIACTECRTACPRNDMDKSAAVSQSNPS
ncbi:MAG: 4Fe-4S binding protein [Verrucomicrobia bacterium]|nr:4Fe-4S binding protein [Verrucomicrobiota bacterium]